MTQLTDLQKTLIFECTARSPLSRIIYNGTRYHVEVCRLNKNIEVDIEDLNSIAALGYGRFNKHGGFEFDSAKSEEIYEAGLIRKKIPNHEHPGKMLDVVEVVYSFT